MKIVGALLVLATVAGCANADLAREYRPQSGVVTAVEVVDVDRIEGRSGARSRVYIGIGSGGSSAGIGLRLPLGDEDDRREVVRYEIDLVDDGPIVVYHPRRQFEIDDCVLLRIHPNAERYPPKIQGISDDCGD